MNFNVKKTVVLIYCLDKVIVVAKMVFLIMENIVKNVILHAKSVLIFIIIVYEKTILIN